MIEVYYLQTIINRDIYDRLLLKLKDTDIWLEDTGIPHNLPDSYSGSCIEAVVWTQKWYNSVEEQQEDMLTYLGTL